MAMASRSRSMRIACLLLVGLQLLLLAAPGEAIPLLQPQCASTDRTVTVDVGAAFGASSTPATPNANVRWYLEVQTSNPSFQADPIFDGATRDVAVLCELAKWSIEPEAGMGWPIPATPQERLDAIYKRGAVVRATFSDQLTYPGDSYKRTGLRIDSLTLILNGSSALTSRSGPPSASSPVICPTPVTTSMAYWTDGSDGFAGGSLNNLYLLFIPWNSAYVPSDWRVPASPSAQLSTLLAANLWSNERSRSVASSSLRFLPQYPPSRTPGAMFTAPATGPAISAPVFLAGSSQTLTLAPAPVSGVDVFVIEASYMSMYTNGEEPNIIDSARCRPDVYDDKYGSYLLRAVEGHSVGAAGFEGGLLLSRIWNFTAGLWATNKGKNSRCFAYIGATSSSTGSLSYAVDDARLTITSTFNNALDVYDFSKCTRPCAPGLKILLATRTTDGMPLAFSFFSVDVDRVFTAGSRPSIEAIVPTVLEGNQDLMAAGIPLVKRYVQLYVSTDPNISPTSSSSSSSSSTTTGYTWKDSTPSRAFCGPKRLYMVWAGDNFIPQTIRDKLLTGQISFDPRLFGIPGAVRRAEGRPRVDRSLGIFPEYCCNTPGDVFGQVIRYASSEYCYSWSMSVNSYGSSSLLFGPYLACFVSPYAPSAYACRILDLNSAAAAFTKPPTSTYAVAGTRPFFGYEDSTSFNGANLPIGTAAADLPTYDVIARNYAFNDTMTYRAESLTSTRPRPNSFSVFDRTTPAPPLVDFVTAATGTLAPSAHPSAVSFDALDYKYSSATVTIRPRSKLPPGVHYGAIALTLTAPSFFIPDSLRATTVEIVRQGYTISAGYRATAATGMTLNGSTPVDTPGYFNDQLIVQNRVPHWGLALQAFVSAADTSAVGQIKVKNIRKDRTTVFTFSSTDVRVTFSPTSVTVPAQSSGYVQYTYSLSGVTLKRPPAPYPFPITYYSDTTYYASGLESNAWANVSATITVATDDGDAPVAGYYAERPLLRVLAKGLVQGSNVPGLNYSGCLQSNTLSSSYTESNLCPLLPIDTYKDVLTGASGNRLNDLILINYGQQSASWSLSTGASAPWLTLTPSQGTLAPLQSTSVQILVDADLGSRNTGNETVQLVMSSVPVLSKIAYDISGNAVPVPVVMEIKRPFAVRQVSTLSLLQSGSAFCSSGASYPKSCSCYGSVTTCACTDSTCQCTGEDCVVVSGPLSVSNGRATGPGQACVGTGCSLKLVLSASYSFGAIIGNPAARLDKYICEKRSNLLSFMDYLSCYGSWNNYNSYSTQSCINMGGQLPCQFLDLSEIFLPLGFGSQNTTKSPWAVEVASFQTEPAAALFFTNSRPSAVSVQLSFSPSLSWLEFRTASGTPLAAGSATNVAARSTLALALGVVPNTLLPVGVYEVDVMLTCAEYPKYNGAQARLRITVKPPFTGILHSPSYLALMKPAVCSSSATSSTQCSCYGTTSSCSCGVSSCSCLLPGCATVSAPTKIVAGRLLPAAATGSSVSVCFYDDASQYNNWYSYSSSSACSGSNCFSYCFNPGDLYDRNRIVMGPYNSITSYVSGLFQRKSLSTMPYSAKPASTLVVISTFPSVATFTVAVTPPLPWLSIKPVYGAVADASGAVNTFQIQPKTAAAFSIGVVLDVVIDKGTYTATLTLKSPSIPSAVEDDRDAFAMISITVDYPFIAVNLANSTARPPLTLSAKLKNPSSMQPVTYVLSAPFSGSWLSLSPSTAAIPPSVDAESGTLSSADLSLAVTPSSPGLYFTRLFAETSDAAYPILPAGTVGFTAFPLILSADLVPSTTGIPPSKPIALFNPNTPYTNYYGATFPRMTMEAILGTVFSGYANLLMACPAPSIGYRIALEGETVSWLRFPVASGAWTAAEGTCVEGRHLYQAYVPVEFDARGLKPGTYAKSVSVVPTSPYFASKISASLRVRGLLGNYAVQGRFEFAYVNQTIARLGFSGWPTATGLSFGFLFPDSSQDLTLLFRDGQVSSFEFHLQAPQSLASALTCTLGIPDVVFNVNAYNPTGPSTPMRLSMPIALSVSNPIQLQPGRRVAILATVDLSGANSLFKRYPTCDYQSTLAFSNVDVSPYMYTDLYSRTPFSQTQVGFVKCSGTTAFDESLVVGVRVIQGLVLPDACAGMQPRAVADAAVDVESVPASVEPQPAQPAGTIATSGGAMAGSSEDAKQQEPPPAILSSPPWKPFEFDPQPKAPATSSSDASKEAKGQTAATAAPQRRRDLKQTSTTSTGSVYISAWTSTVQTCTPAAMRSYADSSSFRLPVVYSSNSGYSYSYGYGLSFFNNSADVPRGWGKFYVASCALPPDFAGTFSVASDSSWIQGTLERIPVLLPATAIYSCCGGPQLQDPSAPRYSYPSDSYNSQYTSLFESLGSSGTISAASAQYWYKVGFVVDTSKLAPGAYTANIAFSSTGAPSGIFSDTISVRTYVLGGKAPKRVPIVSKLGTATPRTFVFSNPSSSAVTFTSSISGIWMEAGQATSCCSSSVVGPVTGQYYQIGFPFEAGALGSYTSTSVSLSLVSAYTPSFPIVLPDGTVIASQPGISTSPATSTSTQATTATAKGAPYAPSSNGQTFIRAWVEPASGTLQAGESVTMKLLVQGLGLAKPAMPTYTTVLWLTASDPSLSFAGYVDATFTPRFPQMAGPIQTPATYSGLPSIDLVVDPLQMSSGTVYERIDNTYSLPPFSFVEATVKVSSTSPPVDPNSPWISIGNSRVSTSSATLRAQSYLAPSPNISSAAANWNQNMYSSTSAYIPLFFSTLKPGLKSATLAVNTSDGYVKEIKLSLYVVGGREDLPETAALAENCVSAGPQSAGSTLRSLGEYEFTILAGNSKGEAKVKDAKFIVSYGGSSPVGSRRDVCGRSANVPPCLTATVSEGGNSVYKVKFSVVPRGASLISVLLDSPYEGLQHIPGSPFVVFMYPALGQVAPKLASAKFARIGNQIAATFDSPTDRAGFFGPTDCSRILSLSSAANNTLGTRPQCSWIDDRSVIITIGPGATVEPGDSVVVMAGVVSNRLQTSDAVESSAAIAEPDLVQIPQIFVQGPGKAGSCSPFRIRASVTGIAGGLTSSGWTVDQAPQSMDAILANCTLEAGCAIPASIAPGTYSLRFSATNRFKRTTSFAYSFEKLSVNIPMVTLSGINDGSTRVRTRRNVQTVVTARAKVDSCDADKKSDAVAVDYVWTTPVGTFTGPQIGFPRDYFDVGTFAMTLTVTASGLPPVSLPVTIDVGAQPITLTFVGGTQQTASRGSKRALEVLYADPDRQAGTPTYAWTVNGAAAAATGSTYELDPSAVGGADQVDVTVTATLGARTSNTARLTLVLVPAGAPVVSVTARTTSPLKHNRAFPLPLLGTVTARPAANSEAAEKTTTLWEVVEGDFGFDDATTRLTGVDGLGMLVAPHALSPGASYTFRLTASGASSKLQGYSQASVLASSPPTAGTCDVSPRFGEQLTTAFVLSCSGFDTLDESKPLRYQFRVVNSNSVQIYKYAGAGVIIEPAEQRQALVDSFAATAFATDPTVSAILPAGNGGGRELALVALVSDVDGASVMYKLGLVQVTVPVFGTYFEWRSYLLTAAGGLAGLSNAGDTAALLSTLDILSPAFASLSGATSTGGRRALLQLDASVSETLGTMLKTLKATAARLSLSASSGSSAGKPNPTPSGSSASASASASALELAPGTLEQVAAVAQKLSASAPLMTDADLASLMTFLSSLVTAYPKAFPDAMADGGAQRSLFGALRSVLFNVTRARPAAVSGPIVAAVSAAQRQLAALQRPGVCGATPSVFGNAQVALVCSARAGGAGGKLSSASGSVDVALGADALAAETGLDTEVVFSLESADGATSPYATAFDGAALASELLTLHASVPSGASDGTARQVFAGRSGSSRGGFVFTFRGLPAVFPPTNQSAYLLYWNEAMQRWSSDAGCGGVVPLTAVNATVAAAAAALGITLPATVLNSTCSHLTTFGLFTAPTGSSFSFNFPSEGHIVAFNAPLGLKSSATESTPALAPVALALLLAAAAAALGRRAAAV